MALPGGIGTLEECSRSGPGSLGMHPKPVIVLDPTGFYEPLWRYLESLVSAGFVRQAALDSLHRARTVDEAFAIVDAITDLTCVSRSVGRFRRAGTS